MSGRVAPRRAEVPTSNPDTRGICGAAVDAKAGDPSGLLITISDALHAGVGRSLIQGAIGLVLIGEWTEANAIKQLRRSIDNKVRRVT
jgi:hypothetical protein